MVPLPNFVSGRQATSHGLGIFRRDPVSARVLASLGSTLDFGQGNVIPTSVHEGSGRAGGAEALGDLRALRLSHHCSVSTHLRPCLSSTSARLHTESEPGASSLECNNSIYPAPLQHADQASHG